MAIVVVVGYRHCRRIGGYRKIHRRLECAITISQHDLYIGLTLEVCDRQI